MTSEVLTKRLAALSVSQRVTALSMIYGKLTVCTRELFMPDRTKGKEQLVITMLHGINELHHTLGQPGSYRFTKRVALHHWGIVKSQIRPAAAPPDLLPPLEAVIVLPMPVPIKKPYSPGLSASSRVSL